MRTLLCYSGQTRTFRDVWANHAFHLWTRVPNPTVCACVADDDRADDLMLIREHFPQMPAFFKKVKQPASFPEYPKRSLWDSGFPPSVEPRSIMAQFWALNEAWNFAKEAVRVEDFDLFIRVRCDTAFLRMELPALGESVDPNFTKLGWWSKWAGVNDRFGLFGRRSCEVFHTTWNRVRAMYDAWVPLHPETMFNRNLRDHGIKPDNTLEAEWLTIRDNGFEGCEATSIDVANFARAGTR